MMRCVTNVALLCLALALLVLVPATGQTLKGTIPGTITDSTHGVVPSVRALVTETNANCSELNNDSGFYAFANLDPGDYRLEVERPGFRKLVRSKLRLGSSEEPEWLWAEQYYYRRLLRWHQAGADFCGAADGLRQSGSLCPE